MTAPVTRRELSEVVHDAVAAPERPVVARSREIQIAREGFRTLRLTRPWLVVWRGPRGQRRTSPFALHARALLFADALARLPEEHR